MQSHAKPCVFTRHVCRFIDCDIANTIAGLLIRARLDYCNALLYGISAANIAKLQSFQNTLARVLTTTCRHDHISPVLSSLHWLPISQRIIFKLTGQSDNLSSLIQYTLLQSSPVTALFFWSYRQHKPNSYWEHSAMQHQSGIHWIV